MAKTLRILSYNSTGLAWDKQVYIRDLIDRNKPDILFIQETWLLNSHMNTLNTIHQDYIGNGISGTPDDELLLGRPRGGVAILWKREISDSIEFCSIPNTDRACAIILKAGTEEMLCVCAYLPVDNQSKTRIDQDFLNTLNAVEVFLLQSGHRNVIFGGDFNCDFMRHNAHDVYLRNFTTINDLVCAVDLPVSEIDFTYHDPYNGCYSQIDHFIVSSGLCNSVTASGKCDDHDNPSKHIPLSLDVLLNCSLPRMVASTHSEEEQHSKNIAWHKISDHDVKTYQDRQNIAISKVSTPSVAFCENVSCGDQKHELEIDQWFQDLIDCCLYADDLLPRVSKKKINKPYWKTEVKPFKDDSLWWHRFWIICGSPKEGPVYENKLTAKRQYFYAVRRYKRQEDQFRKNKMAEAICENRTRDFFKELKKVKPKRTCAPQIDGLFQDNEIAEHLSKKYDTLYNSVSSQPEKISEICKFIEKDCVNTKDSDRVVTEEDITFALSKLKAEKSDGQSDLISSHLLMCSDLFKSNLAMLITAMITHGYQPQSMLLGTITSIPKDSRGNLCDSNNYRGITLCSSVSKLFDIIILKRYSHLLCTSDLQFAYKKGHSTSLCSLIVKETVNYYLNNNSQVYSCCVDLTKAFDRIQHDMLFEALIDRNVPAVIIRIIFDMYNRQQMRTVWKNCHSRTFKTTNGVRQGGIMSPILFCIYMDILLKQLEDAGVGCWLGDQYFGSIGYADDLMLLSPSVKGLRSMIDICENFGENYGVKFNSKKTVCMLFSRLSVGSKPEVKLCGDRLMWVDNVKHLGHIINHNLSEITDVRNKKCDMFSRVNTVVATFGKCPDNVLKTILRTQCAHLYGTCIWNLADKSVQEYVTAWNRSVRRLFNLPSTTHRRFLPCIVETPGVLDQIYCRFLRMCLSMKSNDNVKINFLYKMCIASARSILSRNINCIVNRLGVDRSYVLGNGIQLLKSAYCDDVTDCDKAILGMIKELRDCDNFVIDGFNQTELQLFIYNLCTF